MWRWPEVFDHVVEVADVPIRGVAALGAQKRYRSHDVRSALAQVEEGTREAQLCEGVCGLR